MHKAAVALLAVPTLSAVYLGALVRRSVVPRIGLALVVAGLLGVGVIGAGLPATTTARPPTPIVPLTQAAFQTTVVTGHDLTAPVAISFSTPMDLGSVASAVTVDPATPVELTWDAAGRTLTISPESHWSPGAFYTVSVQAGALARTGQPLAQPARAAFLTRAATTSSIAPTDPVGTRVSVDSGFSVTFARPVDPDSVASAIKLDPPIAGTFTVAGAPKGPVQYTFHPSKAMAAGKTYRVSVAGVIDADGVALAPVSMAVKTTNPPGVVRFRPQESATNTPRDAAISVRFTEPMDRATTAEAFSVRIGGKAIKGSISWAEAGKVLVFRPASALPYGAAVVAKVDITATSATGAPMTRSTRAIFKTVPKPAAPARTPITKPKTTSTGASGGGAVGGGSWGAVESYYLRLMNCTRTGGWVTPSGACSSPGGRNVAPLKLDTRISSVVSRPFAKLLATRRACNHFLDGNPGNRLARAGFTSYRWAENLGCRSGTPTSSVLGTHLFYQSERPYSGGHYVNLMNAAYDRVGIGVWVSGGQVRLVVDFYHP
ncbi:MAG: Ig-like domain-containing protein [Chloroflexi bacterium]|nr:Ig-like domain-containing protein [Chloroflexota bacterium]